MKMSKDVLMKMYKDGRSTDKDKLVKNLLLNVEKSLANLSSNGMASSILYETLTKQKAILENAAGLQEKATSYYLESSAATVRQNFMDVVNDSRYPQIKTVHKTTTPEQLALQEDLVAFDNNDPEDYEKRLADLPSEWTIVQISEIHPGQRLVVPELKAHPLRLSRFGCGEHAAVKSVRQVPKSTPLPAARNADVLRELKSVIEDFTKLFTTPLLGGFKLQKLKCESRFDVVLEGIRDWLGPWRYLLLGQIDDANISKLLAQKLKILTKELYIEAKFANEFSLLTQCANVFTKVELVQALEKLIQPNKLEAELVKTAVKKMKEVATIVIGAGLSELKAVNRHPVILMADKAIFVVPWEQLDVIQMQPMSRMPCLALIHALHKMPGSQRRLDWRSTYFVVDPDKNLPATAKRLRPVLEARDEWKGTISLPPTKPQLVKELQETDIYLYSGHGSGTNLMPDRTNLHTSAAAVLLGCSSADINRQGIHWELSGAPIKFMLSGSPITLGMLWTVLDRDTDKMTVRLLETWLPPKVKDNRYKMELCQEDISFKKVFENVTTQKGILKALRSAQLAATSKLMSSAFIACGIPVYVGGTSI